MTYTYTDAIMGDFYQTKPSLNLNTVLNYLLSKPVRFHPTAIITQEVKFPDVSFWQEDIDYRIMCMQTKSIIIRAGQNLWRDEQFERNYLEAKKCGMRVGVYWFYDGRVSPADQAKLLITLLLGKKIELEVYIDWEHNYGGPHEGLKNVVAMMELVENAGLDIKGVGLYTGYYFFRSNSNPITNAGQYSYLKSRPLWLAWYSDAPTSVLIPAPWVELTLWQFGTPTVAWGQKTKELDMNYFNGTKQEFESRYGETGEPEPMTDYIELKPTTNVTRTIRAQVAYPQIPHIAGSKVGSILGTGEGRANPTDFYLYVSDIVYDTAYRAQKGDIWWKVYEADGVTISGWVAEIHLGVRYLNKRLVSDAPPPTPTLPTLNIQLSDPEGNYPTVNIEWKPNESSN